MTLAHNCSGQVAADANAVALLLEAPLVAEAVEDLARCVGVAAKVFCI